MLGKKGGEKGVECLEKWEVGCRGEKGVECLEKWEVGCWGEKGVECLEKWEGDGDDE